MRFRLNNYFCYIHSRIELHIILIVRVIVSISVYIFDLFVVANYTCAHFPTGSIGVGKRHDNSDLIHSCKFLLGYNRVMNRRNLYLNTNVPLLCNY